MGNQDFSRRKFVSLMTGLPALTQLPVQSTIPSFTGTFPAKQLFEIKGNYLNAAYTHPMSIGSRAEINRFLNDRMQNKKEAPGYDAFERAEVAASFAQLINADPSEIAWIPSTMYGENMVVNGLSLPGTNESIVTDGFHFHGSLHLYNQSAASGNKVTVVKPRNNQIDLNELDQAIKPSTKLVALSLVSATTGFQHSLKEVCKLAHAKGALVYADIIQAAGAIPIDVKDTNVDFCACATYKWLMGDFGIGFLYVKKDLLPMMKRMAIGYRQMTNEVSHVLPFDTPGSTSFDSEAKQDMSGHFEVGTFANSGIAALRYSLQLLHSMSISNIAAYRQPLINKLQNEIAGGRFIPLTPKETEGPIVCFAFKDAGKLLKPALEKEGINISVYDHMIRISPSFYNSATEIDQLIAVLKKYQ